MQMNEIDSETMVIMNGLPELGITEQREYSEIVRIRRSAIAPGLAMVPDYVQNIIKKFDPLLRMRFSLDYMCFIVEIWVDSMVSWHTVLIWGDVAAGHAGKIDEYSVRFGILPMLAEGNMQRYSPREWADRKRAEAEAVKLANKKAGDEAILEAVDSLSKKQISNFIDVHRAIHTGETICAHGDDEKFLDLARMNTERVEAEGGTVMPTGKELNPGMHPLIYERRPR